MKLRAGVKFHDGTPFNAAAVKANFDRVTNPDNHLKRYILYKNIAKTEVIDDLTVKFTLHEPFSAFINQLAHPSAAMISPKTLAQGKQAVAFHPVGTGPFIFEEWKATDYMKVKKNPNYWRKGQFSAEHPLTIQSARQAAVLSFFLPHATLLFFLHY